MGEAEASPTVQGESYSNTSLVSDTSQAMLRAGTLGQDLGIHGPALDVGIPDESKSFCLPALYVQVRCP